MSVEIIARMLLGGGLLTLATWLAAWYIQWEIRHSRHTLANWRYATSTTEDR